jgi:glutamine amidotransferase
MIDYGAGNTQSVQYALERIGHRAELTKNPDRIARADKVIFPGVGAAKACMQALQETGITELLPTLQQPVLGICVGMQVMGSHSEEDDTTCLNIIPARVRRISQQHGLKVPHMGWNTLSLKSEWIPQDCEQAYVYFVHSYVMEIGDWTVATCDYAGTFSAAIRHKNFYGTQFHTEKSGAVGQMILKSFLEVT